MGNVWSTHAEIRAAHRFVPDTTRTCQRLTPRPHIGPLQLHHLAPATDPRWPVCRQLSPGILASSCQIHVNWSVVLVVKRSTPIGTLPYARSASFADLSPQCVLWLLPCTPVRLVPTRLCQRSQRRAPLQLVFHVLLQHMHRHPSPAKRTRSRFLSPLFGLFMAYLHRMDRSHRFQRLAWRRGRVRVRVFRREHLQSGNHD